mmetsp:Transcript_844/g.2906  ORF Transcript_844/g.2906 Transcript_844/m.2906 type:complete len:1061 (-) Transcript_844:73-3255(-)
MPNTFSKFVPSANTLKKTPRFLFSNLPQQWFRYFKYNIQSLLQHKFGYCLGVLSCFMVVVTVTVAVSALSQIPIIFLRLAENSNGQFDFAVRPSVDYATALNYTQVNRNIDDGAGSPEEAFPYQLNAPRIRFPNSIIMKASECAYDNVPLPMTFNQTEWMYSGIRDPQTGDRPECSQTQVCAPEYCPVRADGITVLFDTQLEEQMRFGRTWDFPRPAKGEVIISDGVASAIGVEQGDTVVLVMQTYPQLTGVWREAGVIPPLSSNGANDENAVYYFTLMAPFTVSSIFDEDKNYGKQDTSGNSFFVDYATYLGHMANFSSQYYASQVRPTFPNIDLYSYAGEVFFNMRDRIQKYNLNDYNTLQNRVLGYASTISYYIGFDQIATRFPILVYLRETRFFSLFIGLIINIIVTILTVLSIILIYSLLMINVENRTFELGVLRMIGMQKVGIVQMVLMQAFLYAIPGLIFGLILGEAIYLGLSYVLSSIFESEIPRIITWESALVAVLLAIFIPIFSSLLPIRRALGQNLTESLDSTRSKTKAVKYNIERASETGVSWTLIIFGLCCAVFGFAVYYLFPLALLTFNITLLLYMFFGILLGMLLGLVLLSLNLENIVEATLAFLFFFWDNAAIQALVLKNLIAHRLRNRKTTIMYSLSLGFIIFIAVSFRLQITTFQYQELQKAGGRIYVSSSATTTSKLGVPEFRDPLMNLCRDSSVVEECAFMSHALDHVTPFQRPELTNLGRYHLQGQNIKAITPNFFKVADRSFLSISSWEKSGFDIDEQLYTERGSYRMIIGSLFRNLLSLDSLEGQMFLELQRNTERFPEYQYRYYKPLAYLDAAPASFFSGYPGNNVQDNLVSFPTFVSLSNGSFHSVSDVPLEKMFFKLAPSATESEINQLKRQMNSIIQGVSSLRVNDVEDSLSPLRIASTVMDFFFIFTTIVAMILCFFSLISSMVTNVHDQAKEIGILRAIGVQKFAVTRVYIYEAFVLVISASIMGVFIGLAVSYTMTLQQILFTQLPIAFIFPWEIILIVFVLALVCSFVSACIPIRSTLKKPIVQILRSI